MNTWFWADPHFDHEAILGYCQRPFHKLSEMNNALMKNYREVVLPEDTVYILGDLSLRGPENYSYYCRLFQKQLFGHKHLILGNHDRLNPFAYVNAGCESVHTSLVIRDWDNNEYVLNHDPAPSCIDRQQEYPRGSSGKGPLPYYSRIWICGHVHDMYRTCQNVINVGVDVWNYKPVNFNTIYELRKEIYASQWEEWEKERKNGRS